MSIQHEELTHRTPRFDLVRVHPSEGPPKDIIRHPGAVLILPLLDDGRICLIENYRPALDQVLLELPAGTRESGEMPLETARRELWEETGYRAERWQACGSFYPSPGIMDEEIHLFVAEQLTGGAPQREPGELITNHLATWEQTLDGIDSGDIRDAKTIVGLLLYLRGRGRHA